MTQSPPILVSGMHRSGTSLTASLLDRCGVRLGREMIPADRGNRRGYFEDAAIVEFHGEMLRAATKGGLAGHPDWGWTEDESLDRRVFEAYRGRVAEIVRERAAGPGPWGFKDPRTVVALDLWDSELDGRAHYLLVYRAPWEVADSMQRLGAEVFLRHPGYAFRIWCFYNRQILDFCRRHRDRCVLVSTAALLAHPRRLVELVASRFDLPVSPEQADGIVHRADIETTAPSDPIASWTLDAYPELRELWHQLDEEADLPSAAKVSPPRAVPVANGEPRLTVVIPCLDHGELLLEAIASVERVIELPHEVIIVNDGSTAPETLRILDRLRASGHRILSQVHSGLAIARNEGIKAARSPYILALDADNRIRGGFVEPAVAILDRKPETGVVYGDRENFGLQSGVTSVGPFDLARVLRQNYIDACAVFRKEMWADVGGYDEELDVRAYEDWALWVAASERGWGFEYLEVVAFDYRIRPWSLVRSIEPEVFRRMRQRVRERHAELFRRHLPEIERYGRETDG